MSKKWWQAAIVYQIYPKSFQDSNDDGVGDIPGIIRRLDYIQSLGVNMIWLNPIFESPQVDNGYDVSDYYAIDEVFGTMEDVEELIEAAHLRGIKVLFDLVLNHTSDKHPWFQEALKGPKNLYRDFYLWADAPEEGQVPNNWASFFGGSVWEKEPDGSQFYFHLFAKEMPDLNWENPAVQKALIDVALFWLGKGVDGFRLDAFIHVEKESGFPDVAGVVPGELVLAEEQYANLPNVNHYLRNFAQALREKHPDVFLVGEAASASVDLAVNYTDPRNEACDAVITFRYFPENEDNKDQRLPLNMQKGKLDLKRFKETMQEWQAKMDPVGGPTLYWNNHDMARAVSRFGNSIKCRENSAKMLAASMYLQKGIPFILNGEEIGIKNLEMQNLEQFNAPEAKGFFEKALSLGYSKAAALELLNATSKDASRGAMQWDQSDFAGFSSAVPWTGVNEEKEYTILKQENEENSILNFYRKLLKYKQTPLFTKGKFHLLRSSEQLYCYERIYAGLKALVICNHSEKADVFNYQELNHKDFTVLLQNEGNTIQNNQIRLSPYGAVVIVFEKENALHPMVHTF